MRKRCGENTGQQLIAPDLRTDYVVTLVRVHSVDNGYRVLVQSEFLIDPLITPQKVKGVFNATFGKSLVKRVLFLLEQHYVAFYILYIGF